MGTRFALQNNTMAIDIAENCGCYKVALWLADKMSTSKAERTLAVDHSSSVLSGRSTAAASSPGASPTKFVTSKFVIDALPAMLRKRLRPSRASLRSSSPYSTTSNARTYCAPPPCGACSREQRHCKTSLVMRLSSLTLRM